MRTTVLLADPHRVVREGLRLILESRANLDVIGEATHGPECVERVHELRPDVAILEPNLPGAAGLDVARRILATAGTRVVIVTVREGRANVEEALRLGVSGYVLKADPADEVIRAVHAARLGTVHLSPSVVPLVVEGLGYAGGSSGLSALTCREREVLELIAEGLSSKEIARSLGVSTKTVDSHRARLMQKTGIHKSAGLIRLAFQEGLITP